MINEKTVTLNMKRADICKLLMACTYLKFEFLDEAIKNKNHETRMMSEKAANMWASLHDMLKGQIDEFDRKHEQET